MKALKTLAQNLIQIASIRWVGHNFEMNAKMAEAYLIENCYHLNDYDGGFESALESLVPEYMDKEEIRMNKAIDLIKEYVVEFMETEDDDDSNDGLTLSDVA